MDKFQKLFGKKTKQHWIDNRTILLQNRSDKKTWENVTQLLELRLNERYFNPIDRILKPKSTTGEGFAAMTLICSLVEFLQGCYEGKSYEYRAKEDKFVYSNSGKKFKDFLLQHEPFKTVFSKPVTHPNDTIQSYADDFYSNVRCGLLHEAATKNNWVIKTHIDSRINSFVDISNDNNKIIYRDNFVEAIKNFIEKYKADLLNDKMVKKMSLRHNFCRKLDALVRFLK